MDSVDLSFHPELQAVDRQLQQEIYFKAGTFRELVHLPLDELGRNLNPALVLAVCRACGYVGDQDVRLASVIQYVYIADQIHGLLHDEEELPEEDRQFPVLVGDAVYGNFFLGLCRGQMLHFLAPIAEVICIMNEGSIAQWIHRNGELEVEQQLKILEQKTASLTGVAARLGAELAGADRDLVREFEGFGRLIGMAWAASVKHLPPELVGSLARQAEEKMAKLSARCDVAALYELYDYFRLQIFPKAGHRQIINS